MMFITPLQRGQGMGAILARCWLFWMRHLRKELHQLNQSLAMAHAGAEIRARRNRLGSSYIAAEAARGSHPRATVD